MHLYTKHSTCHICNANNNYTLVFSACLKWRWTLRRIRKLYEHHTNCLWRKIEWRQKKVSKLSFWTWCLFNRSWLFQQLSLHVFLVHFMSWRNRNSFLQNEWFLKDLYIYIWMSATRNICEIIPKHLEQTEHLQERNSSRSSSSYTEEEKLFMEKMHLYEMSLDHCQALILTSFSPNTENPDDFYLLPIYLNSVIVLE